MGNHLSQSPSLRGSGRFQPIRRSLRSARDCFNPLHCGAVVASHLHYRRRRIRHPVSIPFIAGQWSLQERAAKEVEARKEFQSPSLRGSGRFEWTTWYSYCLQYHVSIPFIAGQWSLLPVSSEMAAGIAGYVSIPFIAGQWSLLGSGSEGLEQVANVSIPFIAGQWSLLG